MSEKSAVFYFSSIYYDFLYQRPQQLFREWREDFAGSYEFYYVEYPAVMRFVARSLRHVMRSLSALLPQKHATNSEDPFVLTWPCAPRSFRGHMLPDQVSQNFLSFRLIESALQRTLQKKCGKEQTKVAVVGSPFWEPFISKSDFDLVCYDYIDPLDLPSGSDNYPVHEQHEKLIDKSDIIFVTAHSLRDDALSIADGKDVVMVSNGADATFFEMNKNSSTITDYTRTGRKTAGYMGTYWPVNMELLYAAARALPEVDFLLIGPLGKQRHQTHHRPENVFILGAKERTQLPAYLQMFDVALIPFEISTMTDAINPVKLYEYFALGKPVVATATRELKEFGDSNLLKVAATQDEFVEGIDAFLAYDAPEWQESRRHIAQQNSWHDKARRIVEAIQSKINAL
ncbi:MAG: glycosyltransferase [Halobacteriota archaeon]